MRKGDEDWVKKCMEYRVEGRRPVGTSRKLWLERVEADMAELEIDKETTICTVSGIWLDVWNQEMSATPSPQGKPIRDG